MGTRAHPSRAGRLDDLHCLMVSARSECVTAVMLRPGKSRSLPISPRSARRPSVNDRAPDPACPARPANVRCVDVRTKPSEMRSPAGGRTVGDWAKAAIPRLVERGLKPCVDQGRASPDHGNRPGVGGPSGTKTYGETRENLHDDRHGARAASACRRAPWPHANRAAGRSLGRGRISPSGVRVSCLRARASQGQSRRAFSGYAGAAGQRGKSRAQYGRHLQFTLMLHRPGCSEGRL